MRSKIFFASLFRYGASNKGGKGSVNKGLTLSLISNHFRVNLAAGGVTMMSSEGT